MILIRQGDVLAPEARGKKDIFADDATILLLQDHIDQKALDRAGFEYEVVDADDCLVVPGLIDPHVHLLGSSGETGFASQTPPIMFPELVQAGVTTVVGTLGVNASTHTMAALLAKAKAMKEEGLSGFLYTGGYEVPPRTVTRSVRDDILYLEEVIGIGEVAISDERSSHPELREMARIVTDGFVAGSLSRKAGVTHFHVGEGKQRLRLLRDLMEEFEIKPESLYPTHVERSKELMKEAIELTKKGVTVDMDTVNQDLSRWYPYYREHGGPLKQLTISSDSNSSSPLTRWQQVQLCCREHGHSFADLLPSITSNVARVLKLEGKGVLGPGKDADLVVLSKKDLEIQHVIAKGKFLMRNGKATQAACIKHTNRRYEVIGEKPTGSKDSG